MQIMGIVNVTPDSFSDGGVYLDPQVAAQRVKQLLAEGADFVDIGGESTRPGATPLTAEAEWQRVGPVLTACIRENLAPHLSLDTHHLSNMKQAAALGIGMINCVGPLPEHTALQELAAHKSLGFMYTHVHGTPRTMQQQPLQAATVIEEVRRCLREALTKLRFAGFADQKIWLDPGFGFGKSYSANCIILQSIPSLCQEFPQIAAGISRKSLVGKLFNRDIPSERDDASNGLGIGLFCAGTKIVRSHTVQHLRKFIDATRTEIV